MSALINKGTGYAIVVDASTANNVNTGTNITTWHVANEAGSAVAFNVYTSNVSVTMTTGIVVPNGQSALIAGNFGNGYEGNVWISALCTGDSGTIYVSPASEIG